MDRDQTARRVQYLRGTSFDPVGLEERQDLLARSG